MYMFARVPTANYRRTVWAFDDTYGPVYEIVNEQMTRISPEPPLILPASPRRPQHGPPPPPLQCPAHVPNMAQRWGASNVVRRTQHGI